MSPRQTFHHTTPLTQFQMCLCQVSWNCTYFFQCVEFAFQNTCISFDAEKSQGRCTWCSLCRELTWMLRTSRTELHSFWRLQSKHGKPWKLCWRKVGLWWPNGLENWYLPPRVSFQSRSQRLRGLAEFVTANGHKSFSVPTRILLQESWEAGKISWSRETTGKDKWEKGCKIWSMPRKWKYRHQA